MLRKRGKLPGETVGLDYALEYGTDRIEMQSDAVVPAVAALIELTFLEGRARLDLPCETLLRYDS
jgi:adenine phosphoribosyltransferase